MRRPWRISHLWAIAAAALLLATPSQAYYHYIHFLSSTAPFIPVPEAFDLNALPNKTVTFFVSNAGPSAYGPNDSFGSVLSQVKDAAAAWNAVPNSALHVAFGGLETYNSSPDTVTPGADVIFAELPPGLLGLGTTTVSLNATPQTGANGPFFPISRGTVILTNSTDPNSPYGPGPSYLEEFYTTAVHEFGHALGLQHTWTSAAMSQDVIRNTSRARPIDGDDIASMLELYGAPGWNAGAGSISGVVTANGQPWNLASVVAIPTVGPAVSALTNPDGSYTINGLVPGNYLLYVHPLPPDAAPANGTGLKLPVGENGQTYAPTAGYFRTVFYPGTTNVDQATTFTVAAGQALTGENFAVETRASIPVYDLITYAWLYPAARTYTYGPNNTSLTCPTCIWVTPAYASLDQNQFQLYAEPKYSTSSPMPESATLLGVGPASFIGPYEGWMALYFPNPGGVTAGPRHLVLTFDTAQGLDLYVLPDAINIVNSGPPEITSVTQNGDGSVTVAGAGMTPDSRVFFDGLDAAITVPYAATDATNGVISVTPPQGASSQTSTLTVYQADGQNSMLLEAANPSTYSYPAANAPQITAINPPALPTGYDADGTAAMVTVTTANTNFASGQVTLGFGSSDIQVRRLWVASPTQLIADVVVANNAAVGGAELSIISGFQTLDQPAAFQIQPPNANLPTPALPVYNAVSYATVLHDADYGTIFGSNLATSTAAAQVLLNGQAVPLLYTSQNQLNFQIPASFPVGPAVLQVNNGAASALPVYVQIDSPPAVVNASAIASVAPGQVVTVQVSNVTDSSIVNTPYRVGVSLSGIPMPVLSVAAVSAGTYQIQFAVTQSFAGWQVPLVVTVDNSPSSPVSVTAE